MHNEIIFISKEAQNSTSLPPIWIVPNSQVAFLWRHFIQDMLSKCLPISLLTTTLVYGWSWAVLFCTRHAPNSEMVALKIVKLIIVWKKIAAAGFLLPTNFQSTEFCHINKAWLQRQFQNWRSLRSLLSRQISSG